MACFTSQMAYNGCIGIFPDCTHRSGVASQPQIPFMKTVDVTNKTRPAGTRTQIEPASDTQQPRQRHQKPKLNTDDIEPVDHKHWHPQLLSSPSRPPRQPEPQTQCDLATLAEMFPAIDSEVLRCVVDTCQSTEQAVSFLLSSSQQCPGLESGPGPTSNPQIAAGSSDEDWEMVSDPNSYISKLTAGGTLLPHPPSVKTVTPPAQKPHRSQKSTETTSSADVEGEHSKERRQQHLWQDRKHRQLWHESQVLRCNGARHRGFYEEQPGSVLEDATAASHSTLITSESTRDPTAAQTAWLLVQHSHLVQRELKHVRQKQRHLQRSSKHATASPTLAF